MHAGDATQPWPERLEFLRPTRFSGRTAKLKLPPNITLIRLPPYAPELNPTENVWEYLRKNNLALRVFDDYDAIVEACCSAWNNLIAIPDRLASITKRKWAIVA